MGSLQKEYKLRDGTTAIVGEYTMCGLLQMQLYPNKSDWGWQSEIWRQAQHDYGALGHKLQLIRSDKRAQRNNKAQLFWPPSWRWE